MLAGHAGIPEEAVTIEDRWTADQRSRETRTALRRFGVYLLVLAALAVGAFLWH